MSNCSLIDIEYNNIKNLPYFKYWPHLTKTYIIWNLKYPIFAINTGVYCFLNKGLVFNFGIIINSTTIMLQHDLFCWLKHTNILPSPTMVLARILKFPVIF